MPKRSPATSENDAGVLKVADQLQTQADAITATLPPKKPRLKAAIATVDVKATPKDNSKPKRVPQRRRLTERTLAALPNHPPKDGYDVTWDTECRGLGVRVTSAGVMAFVLLYRFEGRQRLFTIGRYPDVTLAAARDEAVQLKNQVKAKEDAHDPMETRQRERNSAPTIKGLTQRYLASKSFADKRPNSQRNDRQMIDRNILPHFGVKKDAKTDTDNTMRLKALIKDDIETLHNSLRETPYQANRVLSLIKKMLNLAVEWELIEKSPARAVKPFPEDRHERWFTVEELQKFREALDAYEDQNAADALRLLMLTGSRAGEVMKAEWEHFDLGRGVWTKPSHHTKQKKTEHVPLNGPALDLLRRMKPKNATGPLFPGKENEDGEQAARTTLRNPWVQACKAAGLVEETKVTKGKRKGKTRYQPTVRIHDLRHSYASHLVSRGVGLQVVGRLLGHTQVSTTMRYAHLQNEALREATNVFGDIYTKAEKAGA